MAQLNPDSNRAVQRLEDWGLPVPAAIAWDWFERWELSNYQAYPFAGSWADQPVYVQDTLNIILRVKQWHKQNKGRPKPDQLPTVDNMLSRN